MILRFVGFTYILKPVHVLEISSDRLNEIEMDPLNCNLS